MADKTQTPIEKEQAPKEASKAPKGNKTAVGQEKIVVVLVRGFVGLPAPVKDTLRMLNLHYKNFCIVITNTPSNLGMIRKVKDYVTWGPINAELFTKLVEKRGEEYKARLTDSKKKYSYNSLEVAGKKYKPYFRLNPPRKGFGRKGIKMAFKVGGALGNRNEKINDLIERML